MDKVYACWKVSNWCYLHHMTLLAAFVRLFIRIIFSADVPYSLTIGKGTKFPHCALGALFHPDSVIGENCCILHGVTLGGKKGINGLPIVGNNVFIGAHAII
ncbi:MAG: hypothetical protein K2H85_10895, partial [Allobaculum sp.]|nr:hypothetical protein [Allobaculum sp.]